MTGNRTKRASQVDTTAVAASVAGRGAKAAAARPLTTSAVKPPATAVSAANSAGIPQVPLRPPLERALDTFSRELRAALDRAAADTSALRTEVNTLRAELKQLRQRHDAHTHTYQRTQMGGGGHQWIELPFLQGFIDGEHPGYTKYGIWAREQSTSDQPADQPTSGPSV